MDDENWYNLPIVNLVEEGLCPQYLLSSTPVNGLCVPQFALVNPISEEAESMSVTMRQIQVSSSQMLDPKLVLEGSKYALEKLAMRGFWEKSLKDIVSFEPLYFLGLGYL